VLYIDREGVGAKNRETKLDPNERRVLLKCTLIAHVHDAILLWAQHR
jgi:hypothetical protein